MSPAAPRPALGWFDNLPSEQLMAEMSLWSADLGHLDAEAQRIEPFTDLFHIDVADGHFSPAMLFFPDLVARVRRVTAKPLHVHLMVHDAIVLEQITQFAEAGADLISIHAENANADEGLELIRKLGVRAGIVLQLHTSVAQAERFLPRIDFLTLLGTRIGVKGQGLDEQANARLTQARSIVTQTSSNRRIVVAADGGIREHTVPGLWAAGAETVVMGSLAFGAADLPARMAWVHGFAAR
jgi:ribulose-phosphate 3-epimerase